jgi:hypothetical protein
MAIDLTNLVRIYQENIDALLESMGKPVILYFEETITNIKPEFNDSVRDEDLRKPSYKTDIPNSTPSVVQNTKTIKALIQYNPRDFESFGIQVNQPDSVIRLKTFLTDVPDLKRCDHIVPNADSVNIVEAKYRLLREAIPRGLQEDRYAITYWHRV